MTSTQPIRIGVLGTHSTGKTTLLKRIEMELRAEGITVARTGRLGKRAAAAGLPKMQHHTAQSTEWIIAQGIADEIAARAQGAGVVLVDRAAHDALAYFHAALEYRGEAPPPRGGNANVSSYSPLPNCPSTTCCSRRSSMRACPSTPATTTTPATDGSSTSTCTASWTATTSLTCAYTATLTVRPTPSTSPRRSVCRCPSYDTHTHTAGGTIAIAGKTVSRLGLGAMRLTGPGIWGDPADRDTALSILHQAVDTYGISHIDTADAYGPHTAEQLIHDPLFPYPDHVLIATKIGMVRPGPGQWMPLGNP
ncbi:aldo/keto reductase [Streptomyces sp. 2-1]|uniref:aldo/keto reductase n=1 Tax=Streptomyces sp. 2-1 TaxID=412710 RepID=UPI003AFABDA6